MTTATTAQEIDRNADICALDELLREVADHLRYVQRSLNEEIRGYPTPIPRCDAQFNHLVEERGRLYRALERIEASAAPTPSRANCADLLEEFAASPRYIEDAAEEEIRARVKIGLSRFGH
jgi:hypothetical protein